LSQQGFNQLNTKLPNQSTQAFSIALQNSSNVIINSELEHDSAKNKSDFQNLEKLFVIVAYRDREENKKVFLTEMNNYLTRKE
jgi:hypothetical protein